MVVSTVNGAKRALHPAAVKKRDVLIVSEGPEGALLARGLAGVAAISVTLVTTTRTPLWQSLLPAVVSGRLALADIAEPVILPSSVEVRLGELLSVDPTGRRAFVLDHVQPREPRLPELSYDELVIVPRKPSGLPPSWEHALPFANEADAARLVARVAESLELASTEDSERRRTSLATVVIVGGGETGVALAGELRLLLDRLLPLYPRIATEEARVLLLERAPTVLPRHPRLAPGAARELERLRITVRTGTEVQGVFGDHVMTETAGEATRVATRTVVFAGGHAVCPSLLRLSAHGDTATVDDTGTTSLPGVRVFGVPLGGLSGGPSLARRRRAARELAAHVAGAPEGRASSSTAGYLALGEGAVACFGGASVTGSLARLVGARDHCSGVGGGPLQLLRSFLRHAASGRSAPVPLALRDRGALSLSSR